MGNTNTRFSKCNFCSQYPNNNNPYLFTIEGLGKYNGYTICQSCLMDKFEKGKEQKKEEWKTKHKK